MLLHLFVILWYQGDKRTGASEGEYASCVLGHALTSKEAPSPLSITGEEEGNKLLMNKAIQVTAWLLGPHTRQFVQLFWTLGRTGLTIGQKWSYNTERVSGRAVLTESIHTSFCCSISHLPRAPITPFPDIEYFKTYQNLIGFVTKQSLSNPHWLMWHLPLWMFSNGNVIKDIWVEKVRRTRSPRKTSVEQ